MGTGIFHYYEWSHSFTQNFFLSVSARTAGFNTYDLSGLSGASFLFLLFLMFVGASPAGTGGGMKTSTLFLLLFSMFSFLRGERKPHLFQREISSESIFMAQVLFISYVVLVSIGLFVAVIIQPQNHFPEQFKDLSFEVFSAISTTGLSTGYTDKLNTAGKFWFSLLMFLGRLGPVSAIMILAKKKKVIRVSFPKDKVLVG